MLRLPVSLTQLEVPMKSRNFLLRTVNTTRSTLCWQTQRYRNSFQYSRFPSPIFADEERHVGVHVQHAHVPHCRNGKRVAFKIKRCARVN